MTEVSSNVARFLSISARQNPRFTAIKAPLGRASSGSIDYAQLTFAELEVEASATARVLLERGIHRGSRVLLMVKPGLDLIRITFALFKIGAVPVVIDPGMGIRAFLGCVRRTQPEALIGIPLAHILANVFRRSMRSLRIRIWVTGGFTKSIQTAALRSPLDAVNATEEDLAAILFTSGSTGAPKGVCYAHGQFDAQVRMIREQYRIESGEVDLPMLPIFALFNPALGMTTVVPEINPSRPATVDPAKIIQAIEQNAVTNSFGSPVLWTKILRYCQKTGVRLPTVKRILMAGAPVPPSLMRDLKPFIPNATIHTPYGATEALPVTSNDSDTILSETWEMTQGGAGTCVGRALPEVEIGIVAIEDGVIADGTELKFLEPGVVGEIIVSGPVVTREYDNLPEATAASKILDSKGRFWHRMGDVGYLDADKRLWFCGRKVERVQVSGSVLYTDCCEAVFNQHPKVFRSALIGLGDPPEQRPALVVEPDGDERPSIESLKELGKKHPHTAGIETFFFKKSFPVDVRHNAKIHRLSLRKEFDRR